MRSIPNQKQSEQAVSCSNISGTWLRKERVSPLKPHSLPEHMPTGLLNCDKLDIRYTCFITGSIARTWQSRGLRIECVPEDITFPRTRFADAIRGASEISLNFIVQL